MGGTGTKNGGRCWGWARREGGGTGGWARAADMHPADTAKETVQVRVASTVRRWRGGRMHSRNRAYGLGGQGQATRAQRTVAGAEDGHSEKVEGRADGRVLQI